MMVPASSVISARAFLASVVAFPASLEAEWMAFKPERYDNPCLEDEVWRRAVLTQPAAIKVAPHVKNAAL